MPNRTSPILVLLLLAPGAPAATILCTATATYDGAGVTASETAPASAAATLPHPAITPAAGATAAYGRLSARAAVTPTVPATPDGHPGAVARGEAAFTDLLRVEAPGGPAPAYLVYSFSIEGSSTGEEEAGSLGDVGVFLTHNAGEPETILEESTEGGFFLSIPHALAPGGTADLRVSIFSIAMLGAGSGEEPAFAGFTVTLTGIAVLDASMAEIAGAGITAESGASYAVPAPGVAMAAGVWAGVAAFRRRRG